MIAAFHLERPTMSAYEFSFKTIDDAPMPLAAYRGQVMLVVNTASYCGLTPQYEGLEALHRRLGHSGLVVIGVPANDFGMQEPGTADEIKNFCTTKFAVDFPLTAKERVIGEEAHPFYKWAATKLGDDAAPKWNFHKYLVGRDGELVGVFGSRVEPTAPDLVAAVEAALAK
ncbi:MAG: glutathione peroxidase [Aliidongia sp.]|jgi:glutathione peroxidase|nr:glutathione peroxidase [Aliidongia sp.]